MNKVTKISDDEYTVGLFTVKLKKKGRGDDSPLQYTVKNTIITDDLGETVDLDTLKEAILEKVHEYLKTT